jgi:arsenical pump membrane protein
MTDLLAMPSAYLAVWLISLASIAFVLIRPKGLPEALWAVIGAGLLVISKLLPLGDALHAIAKGTDVYFFLAGMMIISELARREGVFDWVAFHAVKAARGSERRLFLLVYGVGIVVTVFLSNDATAVVLTPAVQAAVKTAGAGPLPFLFVCAFIANAASFVLPISNPANLVVYGKSLPPLGDWLRTFGLASLVSIVVTFVCLRLLSRKLLVGEMKNHLKRPPLAPSGKLTLAGIGFLAVALIVTSALGKDLGAPTCIAGLLVAFAVTFQDRNVPKDLLKEVSWSVIPLVAGLFVIVEAIDSAGALRAATVALREMQGWQPIHAAVSSAFGVALVSNLMNNLPSGLIAGSAVHAARVTGPLRDAVLVGIDLGPNLSTTGSLATILWLIAIRREGQDVSFWQFLKWGIVAMPPALVLTVCALLLRSAF